MSITLESLTEKLNNTILKNGKKYKAGSIKFYRNEFKKVLGERKSISFSDITYDKIKDFVKDKTNSQKINIVVMVIKLYQFYGKMDTDNYRSIVKLYDGYMDDKKSKGNELSDKEKKTFQSWNDILETRKKVKKNLRLTELYTKDKLTRYELKALRQYILLLQIILKMIRT
jgi:hypothetical protein